MSNSLAAVHPELIAEWSEKNLPLTPDSITFGSNKKVWWKGACGHEWETSVKARSNGEKCPICSGARVIEGINDLNTLKPELASEWSEENEIKPTEVSVGSHKKVIWQCKQGHEWIATVKSRTINKTGCPYCSHNKVLEGFNDLATLFPEVADEWSDKNEKKPTEVTAFANSKAWWKCKTCGYEWNTLISTRSGGSKCPCCSGYTFIKGKNDLKSTHPRIAKEWSSKNYPLQPDEVNAKSRKNVWWHGYTHDGEFILVAEDGANDLKNYPVKCVKGRIWVNNHAHVLQGKYDCADNQFLAYAISQADIESLLVGGGRAKLNAETLMGIDLLLPNKAEQIRIGKYLAQLDNLITLHQREFAFLCKEKSKKFRYIKNAWEQRKFGEVFDCTVPNNTLSRAELSYDEGTVLNVHYGDVLIKYGSVLDVQKDDIPRIPHRCREDFNGALLQDGDVIIADTAEDETTGKACEIGNLQGSAIVSGLHTMVCRPRNRMALGYLGYYLNSNAYHYQLLPLMQGIKVLSLSRSNIQKTSVSYPSAMKEQQLIASYFSQLDHLITLHQRKPNFYTGGYYAE